MDRIIAMNMFVRVVETGSFSAVARELETTQPTVSKNIAELENWLGAKLLSRSTRKLHLTEAGSDYYERCLTILQDIEEAEQNVGQLQTQVKGTVKVSAPVAFGRLCIIPLLHDFFEMYPDIRVELTLNDFNIDLVEEGVDLALRMGNLSDSALIAKKLTASPMITVATPAYLQKYGTPSHPRDLKKHDSIIYTGLEKMYEMEYQEDGRPFTVHITGKLLTNNTEALREGLLRGYGVKMVPKWLVSDALDNGQLVSVLNEFSPSAHDISAVFLSGRHLPTKARRLIDFLAERLQNLQ